MKVKLVDIIDAIDMMDQYSEYFLDKETGEIEWISDMTMSRDEQDEIYDRLDEHGFIGCLHLLNSGITTSWRSL